MIDNTALKAAIAYFEDAVRESDEIMADCSPNLQRELTEQKAHFAVALEVMRRAEPKNEPLTLEELRGMNGEPVYCVDAKEKGIWALVHTRDEVCTDADFGDWEFYCYGWMDSEVGWLAYKRKPEGGQDERNV